MFILLLIAAVLVGSVVMHKRWLDLDHWDSKHWNPVTKRFFNHWSNVHKIITFKVLWEFLRAPKAIWPKKLIVQPAPVIQSTDELRITNIGHATFLIQMAGCNIITDPVFSSHAGPFGKLGPRRVIDPGISIDQLPPIDVAFISHNHYDHLDKSSVMSLAQHANIIFIVPLGVKKTLIMWGVQRPVIELDWWASHTVNTVKITAVPAQHWSRRSLFDINKTLWMGGVIESEHGSVFFAGDTGLGSHFAEIAEKFRNINVGLLPIGSYKPRTVMKQQHMGPLDALEAHQILKAECIIPIHYDVFPLGKEQFLEAEHELLFEAKNLGIPKNQLKVLKVGQFEQW
jgi:L-ascorbate metabolism protein UlaG (beta-lactamase superfamily)